MSSILRRLGVLPNPALAGFVPRIMNGVVEIPVYHMRGGTSTGCVVWHEHLPSELDLKEEAIRWIMGVPQQGDVKGNNQITGLGRGVATSNKFFILAPGDGQQAELNSTLAQLAADKSSIDWSVNCGNMMSALPLYALDTGVIRPVEATGEAQTRMRIFNTNTSVITDASMRTVMTSSFSSSSSASYPEWYSPADTEIPGVMGQFPGVELSLRDPVGSKTGLLLPTGRVRDVFDGLEASCVDVAVPMVLLRAADLGMTGRETIAELKANKPLLERLRRVWVAAGRAMKLKSKGREMSEEELARSETIPKVCFLASPDPAIDGPDVGIVVRYYTPQEPHSSLAVTGGCCLAVACLIPGSVAHELARGLPSLSSHTRVCTVAMNNPAGVLRASVGVSIEQNGNHHHHHHHHHHQDDLQTPKTQEQGPSCDDDVKSTTSSSSSSASSSPSSSSSSSPSSSADAPKAAAAPKVNVSYAAYVRSAQIFLRGHVPLYGASVRLREWALQFQQ